MDEYKKFVLIYEEMKFSYVLPKHLYPEDFLDNFATKDDENNSADNDGDNWDGEEDFVSKDEECEENMEGSEHCNSLFKVFQVFCNKGLSSLLIETRLRSTMVDNRLSDLMIIPCESDVKVDEEVVVDMFAELNPTLTNMLKYWRSAWTPNMRFKHSCKKVYLKKIYNNILT